MSELGDLLRRAATAFHFEPDKPPRISPDLSVGDVIALVDDLWDAFDLEENGDVEQK